MILIALGSNQSGPWGNPEQTVKRALVELNSGPIRVKRASALIQTMPFGVLNQPNFVNGVALIETALSPHTLLRRLHLIERNAGRKRGRRWGPRTLDLDLLDYHGLRMKQKGRVQKALVLPHPGISERLFVLEPIAEIAPRWKHPVNHKTAASMIQKL
jgi:2-amino-4-hydroxy-6-hydroxymethyldihydropteridine diphosphokinase